MSINILMIRSNPVNPDSRVEKEAMTLFRTGYNVTIYAWDRSFNHKIIFAKKKISGFEIPIVRIGFKAKFGAGIKSIVPFLKFQFSIRKWIRRNKKQIDIIHACDFDTAFFI